MHFDDASHFDHLKIRHLKLLELLQETGSLRRAADLLFVTQPSVTMMLKDLEKMFGAALVLRSHNGVQLTAAGMEVRERLRVAMNEVSAARIAAAQADKPQLLRVGAIPIALIKIIPTAIRRLDESGCLPQISIQEGTVESLLDALLDGELDCVVARIENNDQQDKYLKRLCYDSIGEESLHVICNPNHPLAKKRKLTLNDISRSQWVLPRAGSLTRKEFNGVFIRAGLHPPSPAIESQSFYSNISIIMATNMLGLAPKIAIERFERSVNVLPVAFTYPRGPISLIYRRENQHMNSIQLLRRVIKT